MTLSGTYVSTRKTIVKLRKITLFKAVGLQQISVRTAELVALTAFNDYL